MIKREQSERRLRKKIRIRKKVIGTSERPRLTIYRSLKHIYAQVVDDAAGKTLVAASTMTKTLKEELGKCKTPMERCKTIGKSLARLALEKNIKSVVFDRSGYLYHGRIKAIADGAREGGLQF